MGAFLYYLLTIFQVASYIAGIPAIVCRICLIIKSEHTSHFSMVFSRMWYLTHNLIYWFMIVKADMLLLIILWICRTHLDTRNVIKCLNICFFL